MKDDSPYLDHILEAIDKISAYAAAGQDEFFRDSMIQDAVIRNFEIIGEAAKRLSPEAIALSPEIQWRRIAGFRDVLIHNYMGVDIQEVWNVIQVHLPKLRQTTQRLLNRL